MLKDETVFLMKRSASGAKVGCIVADEIGETSTKMFKRQ